MGLVKFRTTSDIKDVERDHQKLQRENAKLIEQNHKLTQASKEAQREGSRAMQRQSSLVGDGIKGFASMASGVLGVGGAVATVTQAYGQWRQEVEAFGQRHREFTQGLVRDLSTTGDLLQGAEVQRAIESMPGATREQAKQAFVGISDAAPTESLKRRLALTREVVKQAATGQDLAGLGGVVGELAKTFTDKSADDLLDIATTLRSQAGKNIGQIASREFLGSADALAQAGIRRERALGLGVAALQSNVSPEAINALARAIAQPGEKVAAKTERVQFVDERGRVGTREQALPLGEKDLAKNRFIDADAQERLRLLLNDKITREAVLGAEQAVRIGQIDPQRFAQRSAEIIRSQRGDAAKLEREALSQFAAGAEAISEQQSKVERDKATRLLAAREAQAQRAQEFIQAETSDLGPVARFRAMTEARLNRMVGGAVPTSADLGLDPNAPQPTLESQRVLGGVQSQGFIDQEAIRRFQRQEEAASRQIQLLEEQVKAQQEANRLAAQSQQAQAAAVKQTAAAARVGQDRESQ